MLSESQLKEFGERGFLVVPNVVPAEVVEQASRRIDEVIAADPPAEGHVGHHFYFLKAADEPALIAPLMAQGPDHVSGFSCAEALVGPDVLVTPWQVQVALNIPPHPLSPGRPHIDARNAEPDPEVVPNTFTVLAGVFVTATPRSLASFLPQLSMGRDLGGGMSVEVGILDGRF